MPKLRRFFGSTNTPTGVNMGEIEVLPDVSTFSDYVKLILSRPIQINLTEPEFRALSPEERDRKKKVPYVVPGEFLVDRLKRNNENRPDRVNQLLLDIDQSKTDKSFPALRYVDSPRALKTQLSPYAFVVYHTANSTPSEPRMRVVVSADLPASEYSRGVAYVASLLGLQEHEFDKVSYELVRAMYRPITFKGTDRDPMVCIVADGDQVDELDILGTDSPTRPLKTRATDHDLGDLAFMRSPLSGFTLATCRGCLEHIDPDESYNVWLEVSMAMKHQWPEGGEAFSLFDEWSSRGTEGKYGGTQMSQNKWDAVNPTPKGQEPKTARSIMYLAKQRGWNPVPFERECFEGLMAWIKDPARTEIELSSESIIRAVGLTFEGIQLSKYLQLLKARLKEHDVTISVSELKAILNKKRRDIVRAKKADKPQGDEESLEYLRDAMVYVQAYDEFYDTRKNVTMPVRSLNASYEKLFNPNPENWRSEILPRDYLVNGANVPRAYAYIYDPTQFDKKLVKYRGNLFLNTYRADYPEPDFNDTAAGDLFYSHVKRLIREQKYANRVIDWLAYHVQHPGAKINWAILITGVSGCGKTILYNAMKAVLGDNAQDLSAGEVMHSDFTAWGVGAQLRTIEEIRVIGEGRHGVMDKLKPFITNPTVSIHAKFKDSQTVPNYTNYLMFSNRDDALALHPDERRYFVIRSLLTKNEVEAMGSGYFEPIFEMIHTRGAGLRAWLSQWKFSAGWNPSGEADRTPYFYEMVKNSASGLSYTISQIIEDEDHPMVRQDLLSSSTLALLLQETGQRFTLQAIASVLREMGYQMVGKIRLGPERHHIWTPAGKTENWRDLTILRHKADPSSLTPTTPNPEDLL